MKGGVYMGVISHFGLLYETFSVNDVELSLPQGTPAAYLAELIGALS